MKPNVGTILSLKIESLAFGNGAGVGRHDGMVVFVSGACPGDEVTAKVTLVKKNFAEAAVVDIITPSPHRVKPPCPVADVCGGCAWQHVDYKTQLEQKENIVEKALGRMATESTVRNRIIPSPNPLKYRNRIQLHKKGKEWGYHKIKSSDLVAIDQCLIAEDSLNKQLNIAKNDPQLPEHCRVEIQRLPSGETHHGVTREERDEIGFSQVNTGVNELLVQKVVDMAVSVKPTAIHDLYAGAGNFSFPLAGALPETPIHSVELNSKAHRDAAKKQKTLVYNNLTLIQESVENYLTSSVAPEDLVIIDPPRAGLQKAALRRLISSAHRQMIYVSCDPMTLKRDLMELTSSGGFQLVAIQPFDMFPQTPHMETLVHLQRP